ncbi:hypothetical protein SEVCU012_1826 [Staphylococcus pettenkoferi VCU012]|nr:hypothetical protein SEVCU012_1826 [Staphylococcus pettenkoferi VCU012]
MAMKYLKHFYSAYKLSQKFFTKKRALTLTYFDQFDKL